MYLNGMGARPLNFTNYKTHYLPIRLIVCCDQSQTTPSPALFCTECSTVSYDKPIPYSLANSSTRDSKPVLFTAITTVSHM